MNRKKFDTLLKELQTRAFIVKAEETLIIHIEDKLTAAETDEIWNIFRDLPRGKVVLLSGKIKFQRVKTKDVQKLECQCMLCTTAIGTTNTMCQKCAEKTKELGKFHNV